VISNHRKRGVSTAVMSVLLRCSWWQTPGRGQGCALPCSAAKHSGHRGQLCPEVQRRAIRQQVQLDLEGRRTPDGAKWLGLACWHRVEDTAWRQQAALLAWLWRVERIRMTGQ
jgi:hypothetical protein